MVLEALRTVGPKIHLVRGNMMWELLPRQIDGKGEAVSALLSELRQRTFPIFIGDDATDEKAFEVLSRGLTIRVGANRRTRARYFLRDPLEVRLFLLMLEATIT